MSEFDCSLEVRVWMAQKLFAEGRIKMPGYLTREQFEAWDLGEPFPGDYLEEETIAEARERMSPDELVADLAYEEQRCEACGAAWKGCKC